MIYLFILFILLGFTSEHGAVLILQDEDPTSIIEGNWKKLNTLNHYMVNKYYTVIVCLNIILFIYLFIFHLKTLKTYLQLAHQIHQTHVCVSFWQALSAPCELVQCWRTVKLVAMT